MRLHSTLWLGAAALAAVWAQAGLPPGATSPGGAPANAAEEAAGMAAALAALGHRPMEPLRVTRGPAGGRLLRGRAARATGPAKGFAAALYAEMSALCDVNVVRAACWRIDALEIDGRPAALPDASSELAE